ncbi:MAG: hypothetical protein COA99_02710 [Moraxellaceae bacterium]|nr:MAG: hypothetical protein COA99_02710 [Moraxellaceae bacterium]
MKNLVGKVAAVTGAGSGIGKSTAIELAKQGCDLAISDINSEQLDETAKAIESIGVKVVATVFDVTDKEAFFDWADATNEEFGRVNLIVNIAGVALGAKISEMSLEDFEWLMDINFWGMVYGSKAFLPFLKQSGEGHIVNVSSLAGFMPVVGASAYVASKFAIRGFTESLRMELDIERCGVSASSVHPGVIRTNIVKNSKLYNSILETASISEEAARNIFDRSSLGLSSEKAAKVIVSGIKRNKSRILVGIDAYIGELFLRVSPVGFNKLIAMGVRLADRRNKKLKKGG